MKKKNTGNYEMFIFPYKNKNYELNIQKFECVLKVLGFSIKGLSSSNRLVKFLIEHHLYNREFVEFISYKSH